MSVSFTAALLAQAQSRPSILTRECEPLRAIECHSNRSQEFSGMRAMPRGLGGGRNLLVEDLTCSGTIHLTCTPQICQQTQEAPALRKM